MFGDRRRIRRTVKSRTHRLPDSPSLPSAYFFICISLCHLCSSIFSFRSYVLSFTSSAFAIVNSALARTLSHIAIASSMMGNRYFLVRLCSLSTMLYLRLFVALLCPVYAQTVLSTSVSASAIPASASTMASSSQAAWWEKKWDVIVVGSGPGGIIGKYPAIPPMFLYISFLSYYLASRVCE
jgi:hypothetical protein